MVRVAPINLAYNPRTLWFNPGKLEIRRGDAVVVDTARGTEFGRAASDVMEVSQEEIKSLKTPLRRVVRVATEEDLQKARELEEKGREALSVFKQMASESHSDMHPVSVEFLLDGDKAVFYFEAEDRVDFRDLVRKLASHFHVRIDMRQIGVRDEARIVGGLGHCGQELCCKRMGGDFNPVSIRMAKEQDLSLNPQKISGLCGRLMCCLRYEYEAYRDFKNRAPKAGAIVDTPQGQAKVVELDVPREVVSLKVADEKPVKVPLADFDEAPEGARPSSVGEEAWERAQTRAAMGSGGDPLTFVTSQFTGSDKLAEAGAVRHTPGGKGRKSDAGGEGAASRSRSGRGGRTKAAKGAASSKRSGGARSDAGAPDDTRKPRRRRSTKIASGEAVAASADEARRGQAAGAKAGSADARSEGAGKPRRSRNRSHALESGSQAARQGESSRAGGQHAHEGSRGANASHVRPGQKSSGLARPEGEGAGAGSKARGGAGKRSGSSSKQGKREGARAPRKDAASQKPAPAQAQAGSGSAGGSGDAGKAHASGSAGNAGGAPKEGQAHRRSRRRSHKAQGQGDSQDNHARQQGHNQEGTE